MADPQASTGHYDLADLAGRRAAEGHTPDNEDSTWLQALQCEVLSMAREVGLNDPTDRIELIEVTEMDEIDAALADLYSRARRRRTS